MWEHKRDLELVEVQNLLMVGISVSVKQVKLKNANFANVQVKMIKMLVKLSVIVMYKGLKKHQIK